MPNNITTTYEYGFDILGKQLYYAKAIIPNSPDIKTYHDAFDRTIKSETTDFAGTPVMTTTAFNALGQTSLSIMPDATGATNTTNYSYNDPYFRPTQVMENIGLLLRAAGLGFDDLVKMTVLLSDMSLYGAVNAVYGSYFKEVPPAREAYAVKGLPRGVNVEISGIAVKP